MNSSRICLSIFAMISLLGTLLIPATAYAIKDSSITTMSKHSFSLPYAKADVHVTEKGLTTVKIKNIGSSTIDSIFLHTYKGKLGSVKTKWNIENQESWGVLLSSKRGLAKGESMTVNLTWFDKPANMKNIVYVASNYIVPEYPFTVALNIDKQVFCGKDCVTSVSPDRPKLSLTIDKTNYLKGDFIYVSGDLSNTILPSSGYLRMTSGNSIYGQPLYADSVGHYSTQIPTLLGGGFFALPAGDYDMTVSFNGVSVMKSFTITWPLPPPQPDRPDHCNNQFLQLVIHGSSRYETWLPYGYYPGGEIVKGSLSCVKNNSQYTLSFLSYPNTFNACGSDPNAVQLAPGEIMKYSDFANVFGGGGPSNSADSSDDRYHIVACLQSGSSPYSVDLQVTSTIKVCDAFTQTNCFPYP